MPQRRNESSRITPRSLQKCIRTPRLAAGQFCALAYEQKMEISLADSMSCLGYLPMLFMCNDASLKGNLHETFQTQAQFPADDPDVLAGKSLHFMNRWPKEMPSLRPAMLSYYDQTEALAFELLRVFAIGLDLPEDTFARHFKKPMGTLRLMHHPRSPDPLLAASI